MIIDSIHTVNIYFCVLFAQVEHCSKRLFLCTLSIYKSSIFVYYNNCKQEEHKNRGGNENEKNHCFFSKCINVYSVYSSVRFSVPVQYERSEDMLTPGEWLGLYKEYKVEDEDGEE